MKLSIQRLMTVSTVFCLLLCCACQDLENISSCDNPLIPETMSENRLNELRDFIVECEPEWGDDFEPYRYEPPHYGCALAASNKMCSVGLEGVPVIADLAVHDERFLDKSYPEDFLFGGIYVILRTDPSFASKCGDSKERSVVLAEFYLASKKSCPKIIKSKKTIEEKIIELRDFGVLALPYVIKQIEKGKSEYIPFFAAIGLHLSHKDYAHLAMLTHHYNETLYSDAEYIAGAEDFDYKVWLSENEEDLDNLFKFLEAYCAEYEEEKVEE